MSTLEHLARPPRLASDVSGWLDQAADGLDTGREPAAGVLPALSRAGLAAIGVPRELGGAGGHLTDAVAAIADVSERSLSAGFVLWGHRTYIEYLLQSPNAALRNRLLPGLLAGTVAGATGLSNAMKHLEGLEELSFEARSEAGRRLVSGKLPWVTNPRGDDFHVAVAVAQGDAPPFIASLWSQTPGVARSADLDLIALRSTNTAAITVSNTELTPQDVIHPDARAWLPQVRPAFLGLQCGMSIGLARRALAEARTASGAGRSVLAEPISDLSNALLHQERALLDGLQLGVFETNAAALFRIRIALADLVSEAVGLELQASGGRAYLSAPGQHFARRWRESAFIPVITPSIVQLKTALARHPAVQA